MKTFGGYAFLVLVYLASSGCQCNKSSVPGGDCRVWNLVQQIQISSEKNREARLQLKAMGLEAVPYLRKELNKSGHSLNSKKQAIRAARALRVIREIDAQAALEISAELLTRKKVTPGTKHSAALINEALACLYENFSSRAARDAFYMFITDDSERYMKTVRVAQHWGPAYYQQRVEADVLRGFRLMIAYDDSRTRDALMRFLEAISIDSMEKVYFYRLAENGYSLTEETTAQPGEEIKRIKNAKSRN